VAEYRYTVTNADAPSRWQNRRIVLAAVVFVAAAVLSTLTLLAVRWVAGPHANAANRGGTGLGFVRLDKPARPISLPDLRGHGTMTLATLAGKPIVLNFWSSTCGPCKQETPAVASVARTVGGKVRFVGIDSADLRNHAIAFAARYKVPYQIGFDPHGAIADRYGVPGLPVTFFLSSSGKTVLGENIGALTSHKLRVILHRLYGVS